MLLLSISLSLLLQPQEPGATRIEWQRTLGDALAVQNATGKPLLVCVNADAEPFCERFANATYLDSAFVELTKGYVCVIASPNRHTESDYDSLGRRIECPRFPGCTCSEHQQIEPLLYERWFGGERYAPRHVGVDAKGKVLFDRYLDSSMQTAIDAIDANKGTQSVLPPPIDSDEMLRRTDAASRRALEKLFLDADGNGRRQLLKRCAQAGNFPIDMLRIALRDEDEETFRAAANALAAIGVPECGIDMQDALARCDDNDLAASLLGTLTRIGETDDETRRFVVHSTTASVALQKRSDVPFAAVAEAADRDVLERALDEAEAAAKKSPEDANAQLALAKANVELALLLLPEGGSTAPLLLEDGKRAAERAMAKLGDEAKVTALAAQCVASWSLGLADQAAAPASEFVKALTKQAAQSMPQALLVEALRTAGRSAARAAYASATTPSGDANKKPPLVPAEIAQAAFGLGAALQSPLGSVQDALEAADLLTFAGARKDAQDVLRAAMQRFAWSRELHDAARRRFLQDRGAEGLLRAYRNYEEQVDDKATAAWFVGYAAIVAAETFAKDKRNAAALSAYDACDAAFVRSAEANADYADSANHFRVLALAGSALLLHARGDAEAAVDRLVAARALRPASMSDKDGLGREPGAILRRVQRELKEQGKAELAQRLD
jgi:hypothetical protein